MIGKFVTVLQSIFRRILPGDPLAILRKPGVCRILPGLLFPCLLFGGIFLAFFMPDAASLVWWSGVFVHVL